MHILLVNDDGIGAKGIMAVLHAAAARGHEVTMCAPKTQQSGMSHRFTMTEPLFVKDYPVEEANCKGISISGSPADCVRLGLRKLIEKPVDIVISGINNGYNSGVDVHYSGTFGAAMEGALNHLPAIASSIQYDAAPDMFAHLADFTVRMAEQLVQKKDLPCGVLNINAPALEIEKLKGAVYTTLDTGNFIDGYERHVAPRGGVHYWLQSGSKMEPPTCGSDTDKLAQGYITLSFLGHPMMYPKDVLDDVDLSL